MTQPLVLWSSEWLRGEAHEGWPKTAEVERVYWKHHQVPKTSAPIPKSYVTLGPTAENPGWMHYQDVHPDRSWIW
jgi:hypothetical protein